MSLERKAATHIREINAAQREAARTKFEEECGAPIQAFAGVVIDEISFVELAVLGHVESDLRNLLEGGSVLAGSMPILLCGDNHQKPPPGASPWYRDVVKIAAGLEDNPAARGNSSAKLRGLELLRSVKKVELVRLMRAAQDETFVGYQRQMRRTDAAQPLPERLLH